jgi:signal transduction histidine kinase
LPARTERIRIDYTLVNVSGANDVLFRYRLDGIDPTWIDGTGIREASYTNLPPRAYRFRLQAMTGSSDWEDSATALAFSIRPMFYQTRSFFAVCVLGLVLTAAAGWRLRIRQVRKQFSAVFDERMRMSREIHDTLLQSFVGVALQLDSASDHLDDSAGLRAQLVRIRQQIEECVIEARNSIWDLRSASLDKHGLVATVQAAGERLTAGRMQFALSVVGTPRPCPPRIETHVLRVTHEAIMNAVRHAEATCVRVELRFDDTGIHVRVVDDGRGFNPSDPDANENANHYGLSSMRERASEAGGRCTIESSPGRGVTVDADFPLRSQA